VLLPPSLTEDDAKSTAAGADVEDWGWIAAAEAEAERLAVTANTEADFVAKLLQLRSMLETRMMRTRALERVQAALAKAAILAEQAAAARARTASMKALKAEAEAEAAKGDATMAAKTAEAAEMTRGGRDREPVSTAAADKVARIAAARAHQQHLQDAEAQRIQGVQWQLDMQRCGRAVGQGWGGQAGRGVPPAPPSRPNLEASEATAQPAVQETAEMSRAIREVETTGAATGCGLFQLLARDEIERSGPDILGILTPQQLKTELLREWRALDEPGRRRYHAIAADARAAVASGLRAGGSQSRRSRRGARRGHTQGGSSPRPSAPLGEG
jgi:hypothetical protein